MKSISRWQLRSREAWWEGSLRQNRGAMDKKVILGPASGASEHNVAKPSGSGCRVDDTFARWELMTLSGEASAPRVPLLTGSSRVGNDHGGNRGVSRRHSSRRKRAGSSCRRVTRPANELEVSCVTKARTEMISTSPFARVAHPHRPVHRVRGAKRTAQPEVNDPLSGYIVFHYPTTVR